MTTLQDLLSQTALYKTDAKVLLAHLCQTLLNWPKSSLISRNLEPLDSSFLMAWKDLEQRRLNGEPVAYLVGKKGFHAIELTVNSHTLIPRPETELLVDWALEHIDKSLSKPIQKIHAFRILDLGTGSGAIALAIAYQLRNRYANTDHRIEIVACDINLATLDVAKENAKTLGLDTLVSFSVSNWCSHLPASQPFDLILSNPPYIKKNDPHLDQGDLRFEPRIALTDEADGLDAYRTILDQMRTYLKPLGWLAVEHGFEQGTALTNLFRQKGFSKVQNLKDFAGLDRVTLGQLAKNS